MLKTKIKSVYEDEMYQEVKRQLDDLMAQENALLIDIEQARDTKQYEQNTAEQAQALLDGKPLDSVGFRQGVLDELHNKLRIIKKAVQLKQAELTKIQTKVGTELCRQLEPEAKAAAVATHEAIQALITAMENEHYFYNVRLRGLGLNSSCKPAHWMVRPSLMRVSQLGFRHLDNPLVKASTELKRCWSL